MTSYRTTARATALLAVVIQIHALAHYPFPCSTDEKAKAQTIQEAVNTPRHESVVLLAGLLKDSNNRVRTAALLGLVSLSGSALDLSPAIAEAEQLAQVDNAFVRAAAETLCLAANTALPIAQRRARLVELTRSEDGHDRRMALEALRQVGNSSILPALEALAEDNFGDHDDSFDMTANSRVAFSVWWSIRSAGLSADEQLQALIGTLSLGEPFRARWCDAACDLIEARGQYAVPFLVPLARGDEKRAKLWALRTLRAIGGEQAVATLLDVCTRDLDNQDQLVRQSASYCLFVLADERSLPALAQALAENTDASVRERAAAGLGRIDHEQTVSLLRGALADADETVRVRAAWGLARKGVFDGDPLILAAVGQLEGSVGYIAADALGFIHDMRGLSKALDDLFSKQREQAATSERQRILLNGARSRVLRQLETWEGKKLADIETSVRSILDGDSSQLARTILAKLDAGQRQ